MSYFRDLFDVSGFPARWNCGQWSDLHGWLHILSDIAIFGAYAAIPLALAYFIRRRKDVPFIPIFWLFAVFIVSCGVTHLIEATIFWHPWYRLSGLLKAVTATVSWMTVIALFKVLPSALTLPGLAKINRRLSEEVAERRKAQEAASRLAAIVEYSQDAIVSKDLQGKITSWNKGAESVLGFSAQEMVGQSISQLFPPERGDMEAKAFTRVTQGEAVSPFETVWLRRDGTSVDVSVTVSAIKDASGQVVGASHVARDISERMRVTAALLEAKKTAEAANQSKDRFLAVLSHELRTPLNPVLMTVTALEPV